MRERLDGIESLPGFVWSVVSSKFRSVPIVDSPEVRIDGVHTSILDLQPPGIDREHQTPILQRLSARHTFTTI